MVATLGVISLFLTLLYWILRTWMVGPDREELWGIGKTVDRWGKLVLFLISIIISIVILQENGLESDVMKWFFMIVLIGGAGFQTFINWKYLEGSKEYIVSLIVLVVGVTLIYFLL